MLGDEVGEKPKPEEIKMYLHEVGLDLIGAAREHGAILAGADFDDHIRALSERLSAAERRRCAHSYRPRSETRRGAASR